MNKAKVKRSAAPGKAAGTGASPKDFAARFRGWRFERQGLTGDMSFVDPGEVLDRAGWARSVGGVGPYLTLHARGQFGREAVDRAVEKLKIHELPAARGCTYVVPAKDFALALRLGQAAAEIPMRIALKLGATEKELNKLKDGILNVLAKKKGLEPSELHALLGKLVTKFGDEGTKKGMNSTLPVALGMLQASGEIRRIPTNGRLDQQRYRYALWSPSPLAKFKLSLEACEVELAARFFRWCGAATLEEFRNFAGLGVKASQAATAALDLVAAFEGSPLLMTKADREEFLGFRLPREPQYALVSSLDSLFLLRREVRELVDDADLEQQAMDEKALRRIGDLKDLPSHAILDRGRLIGLWEFDPATESIAWTSFAKPTTALKKAVAATESYVRDDLGDARSFSLDSPKSRGPRIEALRNRAKRG